MNEEILEFDFIGELLDPRAVVYLAMILAVFYFAKRSFEWFAPYSLNHQLTEADNKAVALTFSGYLFGVGLVLLSVLKGEEYGSEGGSRAVVYLTEMGITVGWCLGGIALLHLARTINDKIMLHKFNNVKEIIEDRNLGTAAVECGCYIGSGLIIHASLVGESTGFVDGVLSTLVFFAIGQLLFILFGVMYQRVTRFDVHEQIEQDNTAAGVSAGMNLVAIGVLLSGYIQFSDSLPGLAVWFALASLLLLTSRYMVDKFMLPGQLLDEEIMNDRNWGAAFVEGTTAIVFAFIINACFLS